MSGRVVRRRTDVLVALAGLALFLPCAVIASDGTVGPAELAVFHAINGLPEALCEFLAIKAHRGIHSGAGRQRHDDGDGPGRVLVGLRAPAKLERGQRQRAGNGGAACERP